MKTAIVTSDIAPLFKQPGYSHTLADEVLCGMAVELLEPYGEHTADGQPWHHVRTPCRCEGYLPAGSLFTDEAAAAQWQAVGKQVVRSPYLDVMSAPVSDSVRVAGLPRGGLLRPLGPADDGGWLPVALADGRQGYARQGNLMPHLTVHGGEARQQREALAMTAMSYLGTQYRQGGKTPFGIDSGGLVSITYLLNGWIINRDPVLRESLGVTPISKDSLQRGDILYFKGHAAIFLGDDRYVHATDASGSDGVVINSLAPASPFYRADLANALVACGTVFIDD